MASGLDMWRHETAPQAILEASEKICNSIVSFGD